MVQVFVEEDNSIGVYMLIIDSQLAVFHKQYI